MRRSLATFRRPPARAGDRPMPDRLLEASQVAPPPGGGRKTRHELAPPSCAPRVATSDPEALTRSARLEPVPDLIRDGGVSRARGPSPPPDASSGLAGAQVHCDVGGRRLSRGRIALPPLGGGNAAHLHRRVLATLLGTLACLALVAGQLVRLAWKSGPEIKMTMAEPLAGSWSRPDIIDRAGRLIATDVAVHSLYADPQLVLDRDEAV